MAESDESIRDDERQPPQPPILSYRSAHSGPEKWVTIFNARTPAEAELAVSALLQKGLRARADFENTAALGAFAGAGPGTDTRVQVLAGDAEAARGFLDGIERKRQARKEARVLKCPRCGQPGPKRAIATHQLIALALIALGIVLSWFNAAFCVSLSGIGALLLVLPMKSKWRCRKCGYLWRAAEPKEIDEDDEDEDDDDEEAEKSS